MYTLLVITHVLVSVALIGLVLIQHGKGADAGAAFGSGASGTVFGSRGSANFLTRMTAVLAGMFFVISLMLAYVVHSRSGSSGSVIDEAPAATVVLPKPGDGAPASSAATVVPGQPAVTAEPQIPAAEAPKAEPAAPSAAEAPKPKVPE